MRLLSLFWLLSTALSAAPQLNQTDVSLGEAFRQTRFTARLPDGTVTPSEKEALIYKVTAGSGPAWLKVTSEGEFSGTPGASDKGKQTWKVEAREAKSKAKVEFQVSLEIGNRAPEAKSEKTDLPEGAEEKKFGFDAAALFQDPDKDSLQFAKTDGPEWLVVAPNGKLSGTPPEGSHGKWRVRVEATDGEKKASVTLEGRITQKNYPAQVDPIALTAKEREPFTAELSTFVKDRNEGDQFSYAMKPGKPWASLSPTGTFSAKPGFADIGTHTFAFTVSDGTASTPASLTVTVLRHPRPPVWTAQATPFRMQTRDAFSGNVAKLAKDLDGISVKFAKKSGPAWLTVSPEGALSGTPEDGDAGEQQAVLTATNDAATAEQAFNFSITKKNYPPALVKALEQTIKEREPTVLSLIPNTVRDPDEEPLTFTSSKLPAWATLTKEGELTLKPGFANIGKHTFTLVAKDRQTSVDVPVTLTVARNPRPPVWTALKPYSIQTREPFKASIASFAKDPDGQAVKFAKVRGPQWLQVTPAGEISGTPADSDAGQIEVDVNAVADQEAAPATLSFQITKKNYPPSLVAALETTIKERETTPVQLTASVNDPDGEALEFSSAKLPTWITLSPNGELKAAPVYAHIGTHKFSVTAKDREAKIEIPVTLKVARNPRPPVWEKAPSYTLQTREPFKATLAGLAKDADGLGITYSKTAGPLWLTLGPKGELSGTPADTDAGSVSVQFSASNDAAAAPTTASFLITKKNYPPKVVKEMQATIKERETANLSIPASGAVADPDGESLQFSSKKLPTWLTLSPNGDLVAAPLFAHIGQHKFTVTASDKEASVEVSVALTVVRNPRPPVWTENETAPFKIKTREPFKASVANLVKDPDGQPLQFAKLPGSEWLTVTPKGELAGTPQDADAGAANISITAANDKASAPRVFRFEIEKKNYPPKLAKPFEGQAKEREVVKLSLAQSGSVVDPDAEALQYAFTKAPPAWVALTPEGELTVSAQYAQIGTHKFTVTATDKEQSVEVPVTLVVLRNPRAPQWTADRLEFSMQSREPFKATLAGKATDPDGKPFTYSKVAGPDWIKVAPNGDLSGEPSDAHVGNAELKVAADNKEAAAPASVALHIQMKNHPPVAQTGAWSFQCKERATCRVSLRQPQYVVDADGDKLAYKLKENPAWLSVSPEGDLQIAPSFTQIGKHTFNLEISDATTKTATSFTAQVERDPRPPVWTDIKKTISVKARESLGVNIASEVKDLDGLPVKFTKIAGPEWLNLAANGNLTAAPTDAMVGMHKLTVDAANDLKSARAEFPVEVLHKNHPPQFVKQRVELGTVRAGENVVASVRNLASDTDPQTKLTFEKVRGPDWAVVAPDGMIFGRPLSKDMGTAQIVVRVTDSQESAEMTAQLNVGQGMPRPTPRENPVRAPNVYKGELFAYSLKTAFGGHAYGFRLVEGPGWLKVQNGGEVSGIPPEKMEYEFTFEVISPNGDKGEFKAKGKVI